MQTGLHIAVKNGNIKLAKHLMSENAYIDAVDRINRTPLYIAASQNCGELVFVCF
jgi:ankyrin repeat protein